MAVSHIKSNTHFQHYHFCGSRSYSVNHIPVNTNAILFITLYCAEEKLTITLEEELGSLLQIAPPDWPGAATIPFGKESLTYGVYGVKRMNLYKFKKILDGLSELHPQV